MSRSQSLLISAAFVVLSAIILTSFYHETTKIEKDPPKTVPYVDIARYLGAWYEQAAIQNIFEQGCQGNIANYSLNTDGTIRVDNTCFKKGVKHEAVGKAFPDPHDTEHTNAKLKVQFSQTLGIEANYWIVRLDDSYSYVVVSSPNYHYLWILYRSPRMPEQLYQTLYEDLKKNGFPV